MFLISIQENLKEIRIIKDFLLCLFIVFIIFNKLIIHNKEIKVCLCSPAKKENLYLKEFVEHYKKYKVDKIFLYDNNDINGEHFEEVINDYIKSGFVKVINYRGKLKALYDMMNDCYKKNYLKYDWLVFYEIDEYIYLKNYNNIKEYLNLDIFNKCETIQLNWNMHTDNNKLYYENKPLKIRFPESENSLKISGIKSI